MIDVVLEYKFDFDDDDDFGEKFNLSKDEASEEAENLLNIVEPDLYEFLPEDLEMDDIRWGWGGFEIPIFDATSRESYEKGSITSFLFNFDKYETLEQNKERCMREFEEFKDTLKADFRRFFKKKNKKKKD